MLTLEFLDKLLNNRVTTNVISGGNKKNYIPSRKKNKNKNKKKQKTIITVFKCSSKL